MTGMKGAGCYGRDSEVQSSGIQSFLDWIDDAVTHPPLLAHMKPVTVRDLGSSEEHNAIR
jgi:hypothetical protein